MGSIDNNKTTDETLDEIGGAIVRAAGDNQGAAEAAAASPFLYARIRAHIAAAEGRGAGAGSLAAPEIRWLPMLARAWRAIPIMAILAFGVAGVFWFKTGGTIRPRPGDNFVPIVIPVSTGEVVQACALSGKDECSISTEDVLSTLVKRDEREVER